MRDFKPTLTRAVSLLELSKLARKVDAEVLGPGNTLIALAKLTQRYLGYPLRKEMNVRAGNWAGDLDQTQRDFRSLHSSLYWLMDQMPQMMSTPRY
jgi:hypothetical protein